jgi:hypothetical protein
MSACDCRVHVSAWLGATLWAPAYLGLLVLVFAGGYGLRALAQLVRQPSAREFGLAQSSHPLYPNGQCDTCGQGPRRAVALAAVCGR